MHGIQAGHQRILIISINIKKVYFHLLKLIFKTLITSWLTTISTTWINFVLIVKLKPFIVKPNNNYFYRI